MIRRGRTASRLLLAILFVGAGVLHFVKPEFYLAIMPPYLPYHLELVYVSGAFEILGGLGVLVPSLRRAAGYGLLALLVAVYPANIQMFLDAWRDQGLSVWTVVLLLRLPFQFVLAAWVWFCMRD
jgi:uncharacterized membrane protein